MHRLREEEIKSVVAKKQLKNFFENNLKKVLTEKFFSRIIINIAAQNKLNFFKIENPKDNIMSAFNITNKVIKNVNVINKRSVVPFCVNKASDSK